MDARGVIYGFGILLIWSSVIYSNPIEANDAGNVESNLLPGVTLRQISVNGISMRVAEMGEGPVVLLAHGWPESWYSWRHQLRALSEAGYRAIAPDMRGYGETQAPLEVDAYDLKTLAADMVGVLDALGIERAHMVGHDWGAPVAAHSVLFHPQRFSSLTLLSVPHRGRAANPPMEAMRKRVGDNFFYMLYHNEADGAAEAEYDQDPRALLSRLYLSPDSPRKAPLVVDPKRSAGGWIPRLGESEGLPHWLGQDDLDYYVGQFEKAGFRGGVNYYRNLERNWHVTEALQDKPVGVPALFIAGEKDGVIGGADAEALKGVMRDSVPQLTDVVLIPNIGHWVQQEAPEATNTALIEFLNSLSSSD
jgi:pimeloyl-ACP methyl ester carboxylesterase